MAELSDRFRLPLLQAGQAQKEVTHNEALAAIDLLLQFSAQSRSVAAPPAAPLAGQCWIVAGGATGSWTGNDGRIAAYSGGGWQLLDPLAGCIAWIADEGLFAYHDGAGWRADGWPVAGLHVGGRQVLAMPAAAIAEPSGGAVADVESRAVLGQILTALRALGLVSV